MDTLRLNLFSPVATRQTGRNSISIQSFRSMHLLLEQEIKRRIKTKQAETE